ncbi:MAG TPA: S41 family peptidase [Elusimicrobiota bacterium]|nr:S41 family peptidase [Elusimicrobiota bacterium]
MKRALTPVLAALMLAPVLASAQSEGFGSGVMAQVGLMRARFKQADYRIREKGNAPYVAHLTSKQLDALDLRLIAISAGVGGKAPSFLQRRRLELGLMLMDREYVTPISTSRWDSIISIMEGDAASDYPRTHDWDKTIDFMFKAAVDTLKDPHTNYWNPAQAADFMSQLQGTDVGIGVTFSPDPKGMKVGVVFPGSGAEAAGLQAGDIIVSAGGKSLAGLKAEDMVKLVKGAADTTVSLVVMRGTQTLPAITVTRSAVHVPQTLAKLEASGIGYVYLSQFGDNSANEVLSKVRDLKAQGATSLILDLRGNPGGAVSQVAMIASEFLKDGEPIVTFKHQGESQEYVTKGDGKYCELPLVVLVDKNSASASEIMASSMQDLRKGLVVVGTHSYGKGSEQALIPQQDGRLLHITINHNYRPDGQDIDAKHDPKDGMEIWGTGGVTPNVTVSVTDKQESQILENIFDAMVGQAPKNQVQDQALQKAVEILQTKAATAENLAQG